jgi:hypothetical protein
MKTKDSKRARVVRSKDREVVGPGYSRLIGATTKVTDRGGGNSDNPSRVNQVNNTDRQVDRVSQNSSTD